MKIQSLKMYSLLVVLFSFRVFANESVEIKSPTSYQTIYEIVYASDSKKTDLPPGVYSVSPLGQTTPILMGQVLGVNKGFNGVHLIIPGESHYKGRDPILTVVDGRLVLISGSKNGKGPKTLFLGTSENPIQDTFTGKSITLPKIENASDLSVHGDFLRGYIDGDAGENFVTTLIVSVRYKHLFGTGFTFFLNLINGSTLQGPMEALKKKSTLLSYEFSPREQLEKFVYTYRLNTQFISKNVDIFSPVLISSFIAQINNMGDSKLLKFWAAQAKSVLKSLEKPDGRILEKAPVPSLNPLTFEREFKQAPVLMLNERFPGIYQTFDPQTSEWSIHYLQELGTHLSPPPLIFVSKDKLKGTRILKDKVEEDPITHKLKTYTSAIGAQFLLFKVDGGYSFVFRETGSKYLRGKFQHEDLQSLDFIDPIKLTEGEVTYYFFLMSYKTRAQKQLTSLYVFTQQDDRLVLFKKENLLRKKISALEMKARISNSNGRLGFDLETPFKGEKDYQRRFEEAKRTQAFVNFKYNIHPQDSLEPRIFYEQEKKIVPLVTDLAYFKEYEPSKIFKVSHSGVYINNPQTQDRKYIPGQLFYKSSRSGYDRYLLESKKLYFSFNEFRYYIPLTVSLFPLAMQSGNVDNPSEFQMIMTIGATDPHRKLNSQFWIQKFKVPFKNFVGARIIQGKRAHENEFTLLLLYENQNNKASQGLSIWTMTGRIKFIDIFDTNKSPEFKFESVTQDWLNDTTTPISNMRSLKDRLKSDASGQWYWIKTPGISSADRTFAISSLLNPNSTIFPNRQSDGSVKLRMNEEVDGFDEGGYWRGTWNITSKYDLLNKKQGINDEVKKMKDLITSGKKTSVKSFFDPYPALYEFLESFANGQKKAEEQKRTILIVDSQTKEEIIKLMSFLLSEGDGAFSIEGKKTKYFDFSWFDESSTAGEIKDELRRIRRVLNEKKALLFVDMSSVISESTLIVEKPAGEINSEGQEATEEENVNLSRILLLATEGEANSLETYRSSDYESRIPMLILSTPEELSKLEERFPKEIEAQILNQFQINHLFHTTPWTVSPPSSRKTTPEILKYSKIPVSTEEQRIFWKLSDILEKTSDGSLKGQQIIIKTSERLKPLVHKMILSRWASPNKEITWPWSYKNPQTLLFQVRGGKEHNSQTVVTNSFESMRAASDFKNVVLYAQLAEVLNIDRPAPSTTRSYLIKDPSSLREGLMDESEKSSDEIERNENEDSTDESMLQKDRVIPHLFWLMNTEGQRVQPSVKKNWKLSSEVNKKLTTIVLASDIELGMLENELSFESKFINLKEDFQIITFEAPTEVGKYDLLEALLKRPEIKSLEYNFELEGLSSEEARRQLVFHLINRADQIAQQKNIEATEAFIRVFTEFRRSLLDDVELRRNRVITKNYIERFFSRVFPMPLKTSNLENGDPLKRMSDMPTFIREWRKSGYEGSNDLKQRVIQNILSQTRPSDGGRPVLSSFILFGGTGSGKTYLVESLVKLLGLKLYDPNASSNEDAEAIIIKVDHIMKEGGDGIHGLTVDQVISQIEDLLTQPKGYRAWILFDDIHKAKSLEIYSDLIAFIQRFFDNNSGMITVRRKKTGEIRDIPVQNITMMMTLNPEPDEDIKKKFKGKVDDLKGEVLAALSYSNKFKIEESFIARWSDLINVDKFPRAAKVPALVGKVREATQHSGTYVLVDPLAINKVVDQYPNAHSREFLFPAAVALTTIPGQARSADIYLVTAKDAAAGTSVPREMDASSLQTAARMLTNFNPISRDDMKSQLLLTSFVFHNFRNALFSQISLEAQNHEDLFIDVSGFTSNLRRNFLLAMSTHPLENPRLPLAEISIRPKELGYLTKSQFDELYDIQKNKMNSWTYYPFEFLLRDHLENFHAENFLTGSMYSSADRTQMDVLTVFVREVRVRLEKMMVIYLRMKDMEEIHQISSWNQGEMRQWFEQLPAKDPVRDYQDQVKELVALFKQFQFQILNPSVKSDIAKELTETFYDQARLYAYVVDKALTQMPWALVTKFVQDIVDISKDLSLGQKSSFIDYSYRHYLSPFSVVTAELAQETFNNLKASSEYRSLEKRLIKLNSPSPGGPQCGPLFGGPK